MPERRVTPASVARRGQPVRLARKESKAFPVWLGPLARKAIAVMSALRVQLAWLVSREFRDRLALPVLREPQARKPRWSMRLSATSQRLGHRPPCTSPRTRRVSTNGNRPSTLKSEPLAVVEA